MFLRNDLSQTIESRAPADTSEMDIVTPARPDVGGNIQKYVQALLGTHVADIADQVTFAVPERRMRRHGCETGQIRPVPDNKDISRIQAASRERQLSVAPVRGHDYITR